MAQNDIFISVAGAGAKDGTTSATAYDKTQFASAVTDMDGSSRVIIQTGSYDVGVVWSGTSGSSTARNSVVVADGSWNVDATGASLATFTNAGATGFNMQMNYTDFNNCVITGCVTGIDAQNASGCTSNIFNNVSSNSNTNGIIGSAIVSSTFNQCKFNSNSSKGAWYFQSALANDCEFNSNTGDGKSSGGNGLMRAKRCIFHDNGGWGAQAIVQDHFDGCVLDANALGNMTITTGTVYEVTNCRFTNAPATKYGISFGASSYYIVFQDRNFFYSNAGGNINFNGTNQDGYQGVNNIESAVDPYTDQSSDNFNTATDAEGVGVEVDIDGTNKNNLTMGLIPAYGGAGGGILYNNGMTGGLNG